MLLAQPGQLHVVRDQYQSATQRPVQSKHLCNDFLPRGKVETASWLIGQEERGLHHKSARQGYTLLFATGKDLRIMLQTSHPARPVPACSAHGVERRYIRTVQAATSHSPEPSDSAKAENSGRRIPSYGRARPLAHLRPMQIGQRLDTSNVQPSHDGQQSTFPGARGAHNGCGAAGRERKINAMQNFKRSASGSNALENMVNDNHLGRGVQGNRKGWIHDW